MITTTIITRDNEAGIGEALEALTWCDDVIVIDRNSTDHTREIVKTFGNVRIGGEPRHDWVLSLHGCEIISEELAIELQELEPNIDYVYTIPVQTFFNGKQIRHGGWHSRGEPRLVHRKHPNGKRAKLKCPISRYPFASIHDVLYRIQRASDRFAKQGHPSLWKLLVSPALIWTKAYIFQLGFLDGLEGLILAKHRAHKVYYSQLKLRELKSDKPPVEGAPISDEA